MTTSKSERLAVLSVAEQEALYGLPDFDDAQRLDYLGLSESQLTLACSRNGLHHQVWCVLQIGYFKAKQTFSRFTWDEVPDDLAFVLSRYFPGQAFEPLRVSRREHYTQRALITRLFDYRLWSSDFLGQLAGHAQQLVLRDITPGFIVAELVAYLNEHKVERPGYTTLQTVISQALSAERQRLTGILSAALDEPTRASLAELLVRDDTLSELAVLKQDARDFGWRQMARERNKRTRLQPLYHAAKHLLPQLAISQKNLHHYASLANFYTVYDLRRMKPGQANLYLLCYAWLRYRQLTDNLVDAVAYHMKKLEDESNQLTNEAFVEQQVKRQQESPRIGRVLLLYVDNAVADATPFGTVRQRAFKIMPREQLQIAGQRLSTKPRGKLALRWEAIDKLAVRTRRHLRPLFDALEPESIEPDSPWLKALTWMKSVFAKQQRLSHRPVDECPRHTVPQHLRPYLMTLDADGIATSIHADRYEFWIYRQLRKRLKSGDLYVDDSHQYRHLSAELVDPERQAQTIEQLDIPWVSRPLEEQISALSTELHEQWLAFDRELREGALLHLTYDVDTRQLTWHPPEAEYDDDQQNAFYEKLPFCDVTDVLRFVNRRTGFLRAFAPLQPRYAKRVADEDSLIATIVAQAMNLGNLLMSRTSDIPYHVLETTYQQYLRLATLQEANDRISNAIAELLVFPYYSFDLKTLYGAVDGQKFGVERPTIKARHSRKYFGRGKGVVAYTLLCNHVPLQGWMIGAHEYEAHYVFDVWYRNTSEIMPDAITGDMHSVNKANFAILYWFGRRFEPRFTYLDKQLSEIYCATDPARYEDFLIVPAGQIDLQAILDEKENIARIIATLGLKERTQGTLIRKLCTYTETNPTRRAIFEFDRLVRSVYTLRYLRDPKLQRTLHRSQNRIESYHQLRAAIAKVGGKKELTGRTDLEIAISNQCGRLIANAIIFYNSAILSRLLEKGEGNENVLELVKSTSPAAWRHIHMGGHYTFLGGGQAIDLDAIIQGLTWE
ncbi:Tn3 family transposase [Robbsia andropogonis]|uniref:Tn3 family transposase n=1 Tax=Robbsia andropogonis TaxID=28092 RepID=UPI002A6A06A1|nr:Tn3 family transposase [Robbsia andropogonis]